MAEVELREVDGEEKEVLSVGTDHQGNEVLLELGSGTVRVVRIAPATPAAAPTADELQAARDLLARAESQPAQ